MIAFYEHSTVQRRGLLCVDGAAVEFLLLVMIRLGPMLKARFSSPTGKFDRRGGISVLNSHGKFTKKFPSLRRARIRGRRLEPGSTTDSGLHTNEY